MINFLTKHFRTDVRYIFKGSSVLMLGQMGVSLVALVTSIAFANLLSKNDYGIYQYILATIELILILSLSGLGRSLTTSISKGFDGSYSFGFKKSVVFGIPAIIVGLFVGLYYLVNGNIILGFGILLGVPFMLLTAIFKLYLPLLNGKKFFALTSMFSFANLFITGILTVLTIYFSRNILLILLVFTLSNLIINAYFFIYSKKYLINDLIDEKLIPNAKHLTAQSLISSVASQIDRFLLFHFSGPAILAEFWIAQNTQRQFSHLYKSANAIVLPKVSTQSYRNLRKTLPRKIFILTIALVPFTLLYIFLTPVVFKIIFPQYLSTIKYAQVFGILFLFLPFKIIMDVFVSHGMNKILYKITMISSCTKIFLTILLVPFYGIIGIIISTITQQIFQSILSSWYFYKIK